MTVIIYRQLENKDSLSISNLVMSTSALLKDIDFDEKGWQRFVQSNQINEIAQRFDEGFFSIGTFVGDNLIGLITIKNLSHITQLFVDVHYQKQGISKALWMKAKKQCDALDVADKGSVRKFTVFSSSYAVPVYESFGFVKSDLPQIKGGISYQPMQLLG